MKSILFAFLLIGTAGCYEKTPSPEPVKTIPPLPNYEYSVQALEIPDAISKSAQAKIDADAARRDEQISHADMLLALYRITKTQSEESNSMARAEFYLAKEMVEWRKHRDVADEMASQIARQITNGWELVSAVTGDGSNTFYLVLKRQASLNQN